MLTKENMFQQKTNIEPNILIYFTKTICPSPELRVSSLVTVPDFRWGRCDIKSTSLLANVMAAQQAKQDNSVDALLIRNNIVTECTSSNFFFIDHNNNIITHPANRDILSGITRMRVIEIAKHIGYPVIERKFGLTEIKKLAKEVFITSTTKIVIGISRIDQFVLSGDNTITRELYNNYYDKCL